MRARPGDLLRSCGAHAPDRALMPWGNLLLALIGGGALYGLALGAYSGSLRHAGYVALKVPLLLVLSTSLAMPAFLAVCAAAGLRDDLPLALRSVAHGQASFALVLGALAPVSAFVTLSGASYAQTTVQAGVMFFVAALCSLITLRRHDAPLHLRHPRYRDARLVFCTAHALVAIQLAWLLRPFIGDPGQPVQFLRDDPFGNAFVAVFRALLASL
ncbi:MAG: hypothetical protein IT457_24035 [Planctomycetes bacterium]|nr:hypothetical protein [Planctomycetota bacterium]